MIRFILVSSFVIAVAQADSFQKCLEMDSISCIQMQIYRTTRRILEKRSIKLFGGLTLDQEESQSGREANQVESEDYEKELVEADSFASRQIVLESYLENKVSNLWSNRTFNWNIAEAGKILLKSIIQSLKKQPRNDVGEGRGKLKMLRMIVPMLLAFKLKIIAFMKITALTIAIIAKKAIIAAVVSLFISSYIGIKSLLDQKKAGHYHYVDHHVHQPPVIYQGHGHYPAYHNSLPSKQIHRVSDDTTEYNTLS